MTKTATTPRIIPTIIIRASFLVAGVTEAEEEDVGVEVRDDVVEDISDCRNMEASNEDPVQPRMKPALSEKSGAQGMLNNRRGGSEEP